VPTPVYRRDARDRVADALAQAPGFVSQISGAASSGYRIEVWESREDHQAWYDDHVAPNLPPGMGPIPFGYVEMLLAVPGS
jgi:hypothetical protein